VGVILLLLVACESGTAEVLDVEVGDAAAASFTEEAPGVLATDLGGTVAALRPVCGDPIDAFTYVLDFGFGCLSDEAKGTKETMHAWIEPAPADWDPAAWCDATAPQWGSIDLAPFTGDAADTGDTGEAGSAPSPLAGLDAATASATASGTWKRDISPCGGTLHAEIRVE
jgi:hypothetical protein